jgi:SAM-dependent methyltransferase
MRRILRKIYSKFFPTKKTEIAKSVFVFNPNTQLLQRKYNSYEAYIGHQAEKLNKNIVEISRYDLEYEQIIFDRYSHLENINKSSILCLAARLGGEVRGFKRLGALAIGIDLEPGEKNLYVLHGDFHNIQFANDTFDYAFTNAIDHVFNLEDYLKEIKRILKNKGRFIIEFAEVAPSNYETIDTSSVEPIKIILKQYFNLIDSKELINQTSYANWSGKLLVLEANK